MSYVNAEAKISSLIVGYLETRRTDMALPTSTVLPFVADPSLSEFSRPCVVVMVTQAVLSHPKVVEAVTGVVEERRRLMRLISPDMLAVLQWIVAEADANYEVEHELSYALTDLIPKVRAAITKAKGEA